MVSVNSGAVEADDRFEDTPESKWHDLVRRRQTFLKINVTYDCRCLVQFFRDAELWHSRLGFATADEMIWRGYELDPADVRLAVHWLEKYAPDQAVSLGTVKERAATVMATAPDEVGPGQGKRTDLEEHRSDRTKLNRGENALYLAARLKRDAPDIADAVSRGEFKSMRAAAIAAGIVKVKTPLDQLRHWWAKASAAERDRFIAFIGKP